ncbi:MAG: hypothetical protein M1518_01730 [Candidatus Thermoplasmatota archaeon]|jgi:Flp pilus assembly protein protease CpaA|nr:hypothetical protein [Candidatus Thermoplasmatota archaeon]
MFQSDYPYIPLVLLVALFYAAYEDIAKRRIATISFLAIDIVLFFYYVITAFWVSFFLIPIIAEFFFKRFSLLFYIIMIVPLVFDTSVISISLSYSILLIRLFGLFIHNFGKGDVKVLQTVALTVPFYPHLLLLDSLFPPVLSVIMVASILGTISSAIVSSRKVQSGSIRNFSPSPPSLVEENNKFWIDGSKLTYKIPFVTFIAAGYTLLFILSLLRLV